ncbi:MAG TPA: hypothetical protein PKV98_18200 [Burkholderiaceae bacterium]|nr:hypothetical protein [Burkholderiaceae bacterium]
MSEPLKVEVTLPASTDLMVPADAAYKDAIDLVASIDSDQMRDVAVEERNAIRVRWNQVEKMRKELKQVFLDGGAKVDSMFKPTLERLDSARQVYDRAILEYNSKVEAAQKAAQAAAEAAAAAERKRAEEKAREAQQEAQRLMDEASTAATAEERERLAVAAENAAATAASQASLAETVVAPLVEIESKMVGASTRKTVDFEEKNKVAFIKWIAGQLESAPHLANLLAIDSVKMRAFVKTFGPDAKDVQQIPGIRIFEKGSLSTRKAA